MAAAYRRRGNDGVQITGLQRLSAGASAETWRFERAGATSREPMILQLFTGEKQFAAALDKRTQGLVQQAAHAAGIDTPRVELVLDAGDGLGEGFISAFVAGETLGQRIVRAPEFAGARKALTAQCAQALADIHRMDTGPLPPLPALAPAEMLARLRHAHDGFGQRLPVFELAFAWLAERSPTEHQRQLVHGDFRNGNFIVDEGGLVAVLDWEAAHLGDPLEDLGWMCMNAWRFGRIDRPVGGFGQRQAFYRAYEQAGGRPVDPERVRYWEVFGTLRWGIICEWFGNQFITGEVPAIERAAIGRRVAEVELDLLDLIEGVE
ncbi:MAG: phosphotransferase family protein [Gammaproteobacteria bacterium]|nr:phosphotransferase family protein [Gammaproteobacteria bacterium]